MKTTENSLWMCDGGGRKLILRGKSCRKELLKECCRKSARKTYVDKTDGSTQHVGYIVGGVWWRCFLLVPLAEMKK